MIVISLRVRWAGSGAGSRRKADLKPGVLYIAVVTSSDPVLMCVLDAI